MKTLIQAEDCFSNDDLAKYIYQTFVQQLPPTTKCLNMEMDFQFKDLVPNVYAAPQNAEKNWLRNSTKPLGYRGWEGYISFTVNEPLKKRFTSFYRDSLVHPTVVQDVAYWTSDDLEQTWFTVFFLDDWKHLELVAGLTDNKFEGFYAGFDEYGHIY